jgi:hypothetical protein
MRFLAILLFFFSTVGFAQRAKRTTVDYPFQVVYAEKAKLADGNTILDRFDYVKGDAEIKLDSGFLILMHHSGQLFEFRGDTLISVSNLSSEMPDYQKATSEMRPDILIFSEDQNFQGSVGGATRCYGGYYYFIGFSHPIMKINENQPIWLHWKSDWYHWTLEDKNEMLDYTVTVRNIYDELLDKQVIKEAKFFLDPTKYTPRPELLVVQVVNNKNEDQFSETIGIYPERNTSVYIPNWERLSTPIDYLNAWYFLTVRDDYLHARDHLNQAVKLSDHHFYKKLAELWGGR